MAVWLSKLVSALATFLLVSSVSNNNNDAANGFYLPGVAPADFEINELMDLKSVKMTSVKTQLPYEFYTLPFCEPSTLKIAPENLGEKLRGDRIQQTPYKV